MSEKKYFLIQNISDYLDFLGNIKGLANNTTKSYQRDLVKFSNFAQSQNASNFQMLSEEICLGWIANLFEQNINARSIQRHISSAKGFFNFQKIFCFFNF